VEYHLKQAIIHNPHHYKAHFNLANTLWNSNNVIEAEKYYRETLRINPNYTDAIIKLSSLLSTQGRYDESEALLDIVLQSETKNADVLHNVAGVLVSNGECDCYKCGNW
jgi:tetratricopeptide (TPR) repeat protein